VKQYFILLAFGTALALAQSTTTTYHRDINGRLVVASTSSVTADGEQSQELVENINGRTIPRSQTTEKIVLAGTKHSIRERVTKDLDPNGVSSGTTRTVIEATAGSGGAKTVKETVFRNTLNGQPKEEQHSTSETRVVGNVTTTDVVVERVDISGRSFSPFERRTIVTTGTPQNKQTVETVLQPDQSGRFVLLQRQETNVVSQNGETKITTSLFEPHGASEPTLTSQHVSTITTKPDGTQITESNIYVPAGVGRAQSLGSRPDLQEQQIIERHESADGSVKETVSVRTPVSTDSGRLGPPQFVSETVCRGKCIAALSSDDGQPTLMEASRLTGTQRR